METTGRAASPGSYIGTAAVVLSTSDLSSVGQGDVLVMPMTSPEITVILERLGAIVTDFGGVACHAANVARERGIPCVVGTRDATKLIPNGSTVRVDGNTGVVRVLNAAI